MNTDRPWAKYQVITPDALGAPTSPTPPAPLPLPTPGGEIASESVLRGLKSIWVLWDVSPCHLEEIAIGFFSSPEKAEEGRQVLLKNPDTYIDTDLEVTEEGLDVIHR